MSKIKKTYTFITGTYIGRIDILGWVKFSK